ncbi:MAG: hypothetical protein QW547_02855 [Candidatus Bathyarchaeia archaeon]
MHMSRNTLAIIFSILWSIFVTSALTSSAEYNWPDYVHIDYGYPLVWGTHVLNTIHGPVDVWRVNLTALYLDLALWFTIMVVCLSLILYVKPRKQSSLKQ